MDISTENLKRARIERLLKRLSEIEHEPLACIVELWNVHPSSGVRVLNELIRAGFVAKVQRGIYRLGFDQYVDKVYAFDVPSLDLVPNKIQCVCKKGKVTFLWHYVTEDESRVVPFGEFSDFMGKLEKVSGINSNETGGLFFLWATLSRVKSFFTDRKS